MKMVNVIEYLRKNGEQTIQRRLDYIQAETQIFKDDQIKILCWIVQEGLLPSGDAVNLLKVVDGQLTENGEKLRSLVDQQNTAFEDEVEKEEVSIKKELTQEKAFYYAALFMGCFAAIVAIILTIKHQALRISPSLIAPVLLVTLIMMTVSTVKSVRSLIYLSKLGRYTRELAEDLARNDRKIRQAKLIELEIDSKKLTTCKTVLQAYADRNGLFLRNYT